MNKKIWGKNKKSPARIRYQNYFLTYSKLPENSKDFNLLVERINAILKKDVELAGYVYSEEQKKDNRHLHYFIRYNKRKEFGSKYFDSSVGDKIYHPNIQGVRSIEYVVNYVMKTGQNIFFYGEENLERFLLISSKYRFRIIRRMILSGKTELDILQKLADVKKLGAGRSKLDYLYIKEKVEEERKKNIKKISWKEFKKKLDKMKLIKGLNSIEKERGKKQLEELKKVLLLMYEKRSHRQLKSKNLLLHGLTNRGKTHFVKHTLGEYFVNFIYPIDGWFDGYRNYFFDFIQWDEAKITKQKIEFILGFLGGSDVSLSIKRSKYTKRDNPLIIMTSNLDLEEMMKKAGFHNDKDERDYYNVYSNPLRERIQEINCNYIDLRSFS